MWLKVDIRFSIHPPVKVAEKSSEKPALYHRPACKPQQGATGEYTFNEAVIKGQFLGQVSVPQCPCEGLEDMYAWEFLRPVGYLLSEVLQACSTRRSLSFLGNSVFLLMNWRKWPRRGGTGDLCWNCSLHDMDLGNQGIRFLLQKSSILGSASACFIM